MISDVPYNTYSDKDKDITETSATFKQFLSRACFILRVITLLYVVIIDLYAYII